MPLQFQKHFALSTLLVALLAGCDGSEPGGHAHGPEAEEHAHADADAPAEVVTHYTPASELFVEFAPLVAGQGSRFAAHVTRLADFEPVRSGRMDVMLRRAGQVVARFRVEQPARDGLFTPTVTPRDTGEFELAIEVESPGLSVVHELGRFPVFASAAAARVSTDAPAGEIGYLKEQQWTQPFATTTVLPVVLRESVPGMAEVRAPADGGARVIAPDDGYFVGADIPRTGDRVEAGDVLGSLLPRLGEGSDVGRLLVELEQARARTGLARQNLDRLSALLEQGAVAERRVLEARAELEIAQSELEAARSRIDQRQGGRSDPGAGAAGIALKAPVRGEIIDLAVAPGAFVRAGETLFWLAEPNRRWLDVRVPETHADGLERARGAWFETAAGTFVLDEAHGARVVQVAGRVDPATRTVAVTFEYTPDRGADAAGAPVAPSRVGQSLSAHVLLDAVGERLAVPAGALIDDGGQRVVYVQSGGETFERRAVETGIRDGDWIEIVSGLEAGERVVSTGAYDVKLASAGGDEVGHGHAH